MSLTLLTGPVRSGKSDLALRLAGAPGLPVTVAVAGPSDDPEMRLRIERHQAQRPAHWRTLELTPDDLAGVDGSAAWLARVPEDDVLLLDCLGTLVSALMAARDGETIVVSNEVGWSVVPAYASGRAFRDAVGRANRDLARAADRSWLVVAGRAIDLKSFPSVEEIS